jgi:zinc-binding in reverse transcriptase
LKVKDFFTGDNLKSLDEVILDTGINFNLVTYLRLCEAVSFYKDANRPRVSDGSQKSLESFLGTNKGIAKKIRIVLNSDNFRRKPEQLQTVKTYLRLTGINMPTPKLNLLLGFWNNVHFPNKVRCFVFSFINNSLPINTRASHFRPNVSRQCTFCVIKNVQDPAEETFVHLFFECEFVRRIQDWFVSKYLPETLPTIEEKKLFFFGGGFASKNPSVFSIAVPLLLQYLLWEMKIQKRVLSPLTLDNDFRYMIKCVSSYYKKLLFGKNGLPQIVIERWRWAE